MPTVVLECPCGRKIKAPDARPGRQGKCPGCGTILRVPQSEGIARELPTPPARPLASQPEASAKDLPEAPAEGPQDTAPPRRQAAGRKSSPSRPGRRVAGGGLHPGDEPPMGLVAAPKRDSSSLASALRYPFWDLPGLIVLGAFPPLLTLATLFIGFVWVSLTRPSIMILAVPVSMPFLFGCIVLAAYVAQVLGRFLVASAEGEIHHPRWPEGGLFAMFQALGRWLAAIVTGLVVASPAILAFATLRGTILWADGLAILALVGLGLAVAQMALLAASMHDDALAASPLMTLRAIVRIGRPYLGPVLTTAVLASLGLVMLALARAFLKGPIIAAALLLIWVYATYALLVAFRVLGLCYHRHRAQVGWFREKEHWGARR